MVAVWCVRVELLHSSILHPSQKISCCRWLRLCRPIYTCVRKMAWRDVTMRLLCSVLVDASIAKEEEEGLQPVAGAGARMVWSGGREAGLRACLCEDCVPWFSFESRCDRSDLRTVCTLCPLLLVLVCALSLLRPLASSRRGKARCDYFVVSCAAEGNQSCLATETSFTFVILVWTRIFRSAHRAS